MAKDILEQTEPRLWDEFLSTAIDAAEPYMHLLPPLQHTRSLVERARLAKLDHDELFDL